MFCSKCGVELENGKNFCPYCGNTIVANEVKNKKQEKDVGKDIRKKTIKSERKKKKIWIPILCGVVVIAVGVVFLKWFFSPEQRIIRALSNEKYEEAVKIYEDNPDCDAERLKKEFLNRLDKIKKEYAQNEISSDEVYAELVVIKSIGEEILGKDYWTAYSYIEDISTSHNGFESGEKYFERNDYANAVKAYSKVIEDDAYYEDAKKKLADSIRLYKENTFYAAEQYAANGEYYNAIAELKTALEILQEDVDIQEKISQYNEEKNQYSINTAITKAKQYADDGDYENALNCINNCLKENDNNEQLKAAYNTYCEKYIEGIISQADLLIVEEKYDFAITVINNALKNVPNNDSLQDKLNEVENMKPIALSSLNPINGGWEWNVGVPTDPFGVTYSDASNFVIFEDPWPGNETYAEYRLYGGYKTLSFDVVPHKDIDENGYGTIKVYADDILVFSSEEIHRKSDNVSYYVDISNAEYIKIVANCYNDNDYENCLLMMNCTLIK